MKLSELVKDLEAQGASKEGLQFAATSYLSAIDKAIAEQVDLAARCNDSSKLPGLLEKRDDALLVGDRLFGHGGK